MGAGTDLRAGLHVDFGPNGRLTIGQNCVLDRRLTLEVIGDMQIGSGTILGHSCTIGSKESVIIGENCLLAEMVSIRDNDHDFSDPDRPYRDQGHLTSPVVLGDNVWLGARVIVTRGVTIGSGTVVGAGAVVTSDLPSYSVAVGVPAKVIRALRA